MTVEPEKRDLNKEARETGWNNMDQEAKERRIAEFKQRRAELRAAGNTPSMFDYTPTHGPSAEDLEKGSRSRKTSTALSSRASRDEVKDTHGLQEDPPNPWENYKRFERLQHEQRVRTNELERKVENKIKNLDDETHKLTFYQRGSQRMVKQNTAQTRALDKQEADKQYDMMGSLRNKKTGKSNNLQERSCMLLASSLTLFGTWSERITGNTVNTDTKQH